MKTCPENCDASCYRCLRSFKNKFEHGLMDRHVGGELLEYLLTGQLPNFDVRRIAASTALLHSDLQRQADSDARYESKVRLRDIEIPILATRSDGTQVAIALSAPLTIDYPADLGVLAITNGPNPFQLILLNELLVRGNLPAATREIRQRLAQ